LGISGIHDSIINFDVILRRLVLADLVAKIFDEFLRVDEVNPNKLHLISLLESCHQVIASADLRKNTAR
jgi:hypothetical protein